MADPDKTERHRKSDKDSDVERRKGADHRHGNIETDAPGEQQSLEDINNAVEDFIKESDDEKKKKD